MRKFGKPVCLLALVGVMAAMTAFPLFAKGGAQSGGTGGNRKLTIGFAVAALNTNSIWIDVRRAYEEKCKKEGWTLITGDLTDGASKAIAFLETCITAKADVVVLQNIADGAYDDLLQQIRNQGACLITTEKRSPIAHYNGEVKNDEAGKLIGRATGKWVKENPGSKKVAVCTYAQIPELLVRGEGLKAGFLEVCPEGQIVYEKDAGYVQQGVEVGEALIQAHPDIHAVMGINDSGPYGAGEAFKAAGWTLENHRVGLFGIDYSEDARRALKEGGMFQASLDMDAIGSYLQLFDLGVDFVLNGKYDESQKMVYLPMKVIYQADVK
ncbi:MAG: sugar ABC transporter substrate-binding protein [Treponema sp.]|nr:sugar ABC transporter substrate-binding protein [Treponema sp.]